MTEQTQRFMQQLDDWTQGTIINKLLDAAADWREARDHELSEQESDKILDDVTAEIKKAVREKVLDSYRNGQKAGPQRERREWRGKNKQ